MELSVLKRISPIVWEIPQSYRHDMRVPAQVYAHEDELHAIVTDRSLDQLVNVTTLPGIVSYAIAMPDVHEGYGFPVGGVAAFDPVSGVISPGGIGYDINCGVRLLRTEHSVDSIAPHMRDLGRTIFSMVPSGVGRGGSLSFNDDELDKVLLNGAQRMHELGYALDDDLQHIESNGVLEGARIDLVSQHAKARGRNQLGTMGAGNHFVEVGYVETIFKPDAADKLGLKKNMITVLIHTGSRGLGHQVATDFIRKMNIIESSYNISLPDRELACAPFQSKEGQ